jgi:hypothetical protein
MLRLSRISLSASNPINLQLKATLLTGEFLRRYLNLRRFAGMAKGSRRASAKGRPPHHL